jgi:hypothetical protein
VLLSVIVNEPEKDDPDCVICHVIVPGPDESEALPLQVPFMFTGVDGSVGVELPPPHAAAVRVSRSPVSRETDRCRAQ